MNYDKRITPIRDDIAAEAYRGKVTVPDYRLPEEFQISSPVAGVFSSPSERAGLMTEAHYGEKLSVYEQSGDWVWGQLDRDGYVGFLKNTAVSENLWTPSHYVTVPMTFLYSQPDIKSQPTNPLFMGSQLSVQAVVDEFAEVRGGKFVRLQHLRTSDKFADCPVKTAQMFVNAPYLWGGKSWTGLDCSGLVQLALQMTGRSCPRDSDMIENTIGRDLEPIMTNTSRGDLVFWKGHVGMMVDETNLIHANGHAMQVVIEPLREAVTRIERLYGKVTRVKRFLT